MDAMSNTVVRFEVAISIRSMASWMDSQGDYEPS